MDSDIKRIARLTAILTQLLSKKVVNATKLAEKFGVSTRTIYRDIKTLESAGVPIFTEEGKGFSVVEGYKIPPIMLSESEANALITAELIVQASKDTSLIEGFADVIAKVKAVLPETTKQKVEVLASKVAVTNNFIHQLPKSKLLLDIQKAILDENVLLVHYTDKQRQETKRSVEPFGLYANQKEEWVLIAYCRLRQDFREFSIKKINKLTILSEKFEPKDLTIKLYLLNKYGDEMLDKFK